MSDLAELATALAKAQAELPEIKKTRTAKVEKDGRLLYSYDYADLADVSRDVLPVIARHGLSFTSFPGRNEDGKFGLRYYLLHSSGQSIDGFFEINGQGDMQMLGGRITYARRYCLCAVTGVAAEEDVDAREDHGQSRTVKRQTPRGNEDSRPQQAMQRRPQTASPAQAATPAAASASGAPPSPAGAGEALPPLPGGTGPAGADYDTPGTVTDPQLKAIWTILGTVYHFGNDEKDQARMVCERIVNDKARRDRKPRRELASSKGLARNEAVTVIDTLSDWHDKAKKEGEEPRGYLMAMLQTLKEAERSE